MDVSIGGSSTDSTAKPRCVILDRAMRRALGTRPLPLLMSVLGLGTPDAVVLERFIAGGITANQLSPFFAGGTTVVLWEPASHLPNSPGFKCG